MDRIACETGALHFDAREGDLRTHFEEVGDALRSFYELAYHSTNPVRDGTFRKIVIRARQPGLTVRARTGGSRGAASTSSRCQAQAQRSSTSSAL